MPSTALARPLAAAGIAAVLLGMLAVAALHVLPPTAEISPVRRTISEYALHETAWVFNLGVLVLALGSLAVSAALAYAGQVRIASVAGLGLLLWSLGLAAVVYFPKHNWAVGPSLDGHLHRVASLVAFLSLPVGALLLVFTRRRDARRRADVWLTALPALAALAMFGVIIGAFLLQPYTGVAWWRAIPLGAVERGLAVFEVLTVLALGRWAWRAATDDRKGTFLTDVR
ncbi:hypothetical protein CS0771_49860 [Catellatospora sp. IY07-71]|uniref:DUF998 domain-containing protein n=1 Tax=Catellatospora sp. IY07-71 TaxID=2728827 RepID=UPI001BB3FE2B|nr:DUF998 domain-containing protein [Catellatospora sp. IY07-71]BCJ75442.1 hypothetical protein CS0771_49860 [Catellatospora sp. IY07-71]